MDFIYNKLDKFNTLENFVLNQKNESFLLTNLQNINFFEPAPDLRKYLILDIISKQPKVSQKDISDKVNIVPAMVNKYITKFKQKEIIEMKGKNHKNISYFLTDKGKDLLENYLFDYIKEILLLYRGIKNEIINKIQKIGSNKKIVLYGVNEIAEMIINLIPELSLNIIDIFDSDITKINSDFFSYKILSPDQLKTDIFDFILITSITKSDEIYEFLIKTKKIRKNKIIKFKEL